MFLIFTCLFWHIILQSYVEIKSNDFWLEEISAQRSELSAKDNHQLEDVDIDPLWNLRVKNVNRLIVGTLNTNSVSFKFDQMKCLPLGESWYLVLTESKLDASFQQTNFLLKVILNPLDLIETEVKAIFFYTSEKIYHARNENCIGIYREYLLKSI